MVPVSKKIAVLAALTLAAGLALAAVLPNGGQEKQTESTPRPNVVLILADDLDVSLLPYMPNVRERVAGQGVTLRNAIYPLAVCCPSRASMLTGEYVHSHGLYRTLGSRAGWPAFRDEESSTYATWLKAAGYRTFYAGKYINGYDDTTEIPSGWDEWRAYLGESADDPYRVNENGEVKT